jgi:hypothetical protein
MRLSFGMWGEAVRDWTYRGDRERSVEACALTLLFSLETPVKCLRYHVSLNT